MARPIVHASDFSSASAPAFRKALMLAKGMRRPLLIVHVVSPVTAVTGDMWYVPPQLEDEPHRRIERVARHSLERLLRHARGARVRVAGLLRDGIVPEQIVKVARTRHADMIVMGTHGRTGLSRMLVGSVASRSFSCSSISSISLNPAIVRGLETIAAAERDLERAECSPPLVTEAR
jgi:nucleotide-binding universal stress UspA family protein